MLIDAYLRRSTLQLMRECKKNRVLDVGVILLLLPPLLKQFFSYPSHHITLSQSPLEEEVSSLQVAGSSVLHLPRRRRRCSIRQNFTEKHSLRIQSESFSPPFHSGMPASFLATRV